jgi:hypothetical protein
MAEGRYWFRTDGNLTRACRQHIVLKTFSVVFGSMVSEELFADDSPLGGRRRHSGRRE